MMNEEKERSLQLEREALVRGWDKDDLLTKSKIDLEKIKDGMEDDTSEDLAIKVSQCMMEVIRIS